MGMEPRNQEGLVKLTHDAFLLACDHKLFNIIVISLLQQHRV